MFYEKRGLLTSKIPVLKIHTIKTPLIVRISISTVFSGSQKAYYYRTSCIYEKKTQLGFSSEIKVPQLGSARNLHSWGSLEPENSSSNSSLLSRLCNYDTIKDSDSKVEQEKRKCY